MCNKEVGIFDITDLTRYIYRAHGIPADIPLPSSSVLASTDDQLPPAITYTGGRGYMNCAWCVFESWKGGRSTAVVECSTS